MPLLARFFPSPDRGRERVLLLLLAAAAVWYAIGFETFAQKVDFSAFRCGGAALLQGHNPYLVSSLHGCESETLDALGRRLFVPAVPDPFPAYVLVFFSLFALMPIGLSFIVWELLLVLAFFGTVLCARRLTGLSVATLVAASALPFALVLLPQGQLVPFVVFGYVLCLLGLRRERAGMTACGCCLTLLEPNIALPLCIAVFVIDTRSRRFLAAAAIACALLSLAVMPVSTIVAYFRVELPAHALSEVFNADQYSIGHLLTLLGLEPAFSMTCAHLAYAVSTALGILGSWLLFRATRDRAHSAAFAPMLSLVGSAYLHVQQFELAIIFALVFFARSKTPAAASALTLLALPYSAFTSTSQIPLALVVAGTLSITVWNIRAPVMSLLVNLMNFWIILVACFRTERVHFSVAYHQRAQAFTLTHPIDERYADAGWLRNIDRNLSYVALKASLFHALPEIAVLLLIALTLRELTENLVAAPVSA